MLRAGLGCVCPLSRGGSGNCVHRKEGPVWMELDPSTAAQQRTPTLEVKHCSSLTERSRAIAETFIVVDWVMTAGGGRGSCNISGVK